MVKKQQDTIQKNTKKRALFLNLAKIVTILWNKVKQLSKGLKLFILHTLTHSDFKRCNIRRFEKVSENNKYNSLCRVFNIWGLGKWAHNRISMDLLDTFGASPEFEKMFFLRKTILKLRVMMQNAYLSKDNFKKYETKINIKEAELNRLIEDLNKRKTDNKKNQSQRRLIAKWSGITYIDLNKLTVFEYFNLMDDYVKEQQKAEADAKKD